MALLKAFVCQVVLLGLYKLFLEQVVEEYLVPEELTRNCLVGFVCLLCFGIQLYTEKDQTGHAEASKAKSRRRTPPDATDSVSEFLDARTAHMMRTLDAAMHQMNQMPMSDGYVQNVTFAAAGPEAAVIEQTFAKHPDVVFVEEIHVMKLGDVMSANVPANEPIVLPVKIEEVSEVKSNNRNEEEDDAEEVEEEESETKSDVCEEEEEDVVTVIDASKPKPEVEKRKPEATESEEEEEEDEEEEEETEPAVVLKKNEKIEEKSANKPLKVEVEEEEEEEEEESEEEQDEVKQDAKKVTKKS